MFIRTGLLEDGWLVALATNLDGAALVRLGRYAEAEPLLLESHPRPAHAPDPFVEATSTRRLRDLYTAWGKPDKAHGYR